MKFTQLANSLKENLDPVYLIDGDEAYFRDHALRAIREKCAIKEPSLNEVRFDGETLKGEKITRLQNALLSSPFFDEKRLVCVFDFYPTEKEFESFLKPYLENPCPTTVLVIVNRTKKAGVCDLKKKKGITHVDCGKEDEETLSRWLFTLMKRNGLLPDLDAVVLMIRYANADAARLRLETEKLKCLLGEGGKVTRAVVEENVSKDTEYKIYELTQAASRGNRAAFYEILFDLQAKGFDENAVLSALVSHYKTLSEVGSERGTDAEIAQKLSLHPYAVKKNRETVSRMGKARADEIFFALYQLSTGAKSGLYTKTGALLAAIGKIFFESEKNQ